MLHTTTMFNDLSRKKTIEQKEKNIFAVCIQFHPYTSIVLLGLPVQLNGSCGSCSSNKVAWVLGEGGLRYHSVVANYKHCVSLSPSLLGE